MEEQKTFTNDNLYTIRIEVVDSMLDYGEIELNDPEKDYFNLWISIKGTYQPDNFIEDSDISVRVNYRLLTYTHKFVPISGDNEEAKYIMPYLMDALSDDENPQYLTIAVTIDDQTYTYIARVRV